MPKATSTSSNHSLVVTVSVPGITKPGMIDDITSIITAIMIERIFAIVFSSFINL